MENRKEIKNTSDYSVNTFSKHVKSWVRGTLMSNFLIFAICFMMVNLAFISTSFGQIAQRGSTTSNLTTTAGTPLTITTATGVLAGDVLLVNIVYRPTKELPLHALTVLRYMPKKAVLKMVVFYIW